MKKRKISFEMAQPIGLIPRCTDIVNKKYPGFLSSETYEKEYQELYEGIRREI